MISGMLTILEHYIDLDGLQSIDMFTDSKLIVKQVNGDWQAKNETMDRLRRIAMRLKNTIELDVKFNLKWASRNNTTAAHKLAEDIILDRSLKKYVS